MKKIIYLSPERRPAPHGKYWGMEIYEHDVCCQIAVILKELLEYNGFTVLIAAPSDTLEQRVAQANAAKVDYYLPIHTNASGDGTSPGKASGAEVLYYNHPESIRGSQLMYNRLTMLYPSRRGIKDYSSFYENRYTTMVSVYPELGFHDHPQDAQFIVNNIGELAKALAQGVCDYFDMAYLSPQEEADELQQLRLENHHLKSICNQISELVAQF